jgi:hypothetical protein
VQEVQRFIDRGIMVTGGMVVGFDADGPDIFDRQYDFAMSTAVPIFSAGALVAPEATPLYERIAREGRLRSDAEVQAAPGSTNIEPILMTGAEMRAGLRRLCNALYTPAAFGERVLSFLSTFGRATEAIPRAPAAGRPVEAHVSQIATRTARRLRQESGVWPEIAAIVARRPATASYVITMLFQYAQVRYMYERQDYWDGAPWHAAGAAAVAAR